MNSSREWWQEFFKGTWQHVQPLFRSPEQTKKEADFIEDVLSVESSEEILDVPCGEGRLTIELASRGYRMTGIDINENFLKKAKEKAEREKLKITWCHRDMREIPWRSKFDAAFCMWGSFGYFTDEGNSEFLKAVSSSLKKSGRFLLDTQVAETIFPKYQPKWWNKVGGVIIIENRFFDYVTSREEVDWIFIKENGQITSSHSSIRIYTYREIVELLKQNSLEVFENFGSFSKEPFQIGAQRLLIIAKKI